jgi:phosphoribosyl 1,2-cyclic phosphodiesterase
MRLSILASGSSGNAAVVEVDGTRVLVDCGISLRQLDRRLREVGLDVGGLDAVIVSHEHDDHIRGLEVLLRRHPLPVLASEGTAGALRRVPAVEGSLCAGRALKIGGLEILPVATSHDAREPVGFVFSHRGTRVALVTDTGTVSDSLAEHLVGCHGLLLEANHDSDLLRYGPYPWALKQRIASHTGHLSNAQARVAVERLAHNDLELVVAMHLSQENNRPDLAGQEIARPLAGSRVNVEVARRDRPIVVEVGQAPPGVGQLPLFGVDGRVAVR